MEVWQYYIFSIRDPCQGNTQASCCNLMPILWHGLGQADPNDLHQVERWVERSQEPLPGFFWHSNNAGTSLTCNKRNKNAPWNPRKNSLLLYRIRHKKSFIHSFTQRFIPTGWYITQDKKLLQAVLQESLKFALLALTLPHCKELLSSDICFIKSRKTLASG